MRTGFEIFHLGFTQAWSVGCWTQSPGWIQTQVHCDVRCCGKCGQKLLSDFNAKMAPSGVCRVSDCTQHGLFFKRLDRHLKRVHPGITMEYLKTFPSPNPKERNIRQKSSGDRHVRRPCLVLGCRYYNIPVSRLSVHLRRRHTLTIQEHESRLYWNSVTMLYKP